MNIQKSLAFLSSLEFFGIKLGMEQTRALFEEAGNPHQHLKFIHVAGSNGKGSVCAMIESALRNAGFKTGFYSSPHLRRAGERFRINGAAVSDETVAEYVEKIRPAIAALAEKGMKATYFEVTTVIAAMIFADAQTDFVIWEVGMGGRLDCTNIVTPVLSLITGISMEHTEYLGDTLEKIASEKAGIIKSGIPVICACTTPPAALKVIQEKAASIHAPFSLSRPVDLSFHPVLEWTEKKDCILQKFRLEGGPELCVPLAGPHQRNNGSLAFSALEYLAGHFHFSLENAANGIRKARWEARFQVDQEHHLILDGAHNPEGVEALANALKEVFPGKKFHFIFGAFSDKDTFDGLKILAPVARSFQFVHMNTSRSSKTGAELCMELRRINPAIPSSKVSLASSLFSEFPDGDWKVLCGSLHLCGEALNLLNLPVH